MGLVRQINVGSDVGYLLREPPDIISIVSEKNIEYKWIKYRYKPARYFIINKYGSQGPTKTKSTGVASISDYITITFSNNSQLKSYTNDYYYRGVPTLSILPTFNFNQTKKAGYYYRYNGQEYLNAWICDSEGEWSKINYPSSKITNLSGFNDPDYPTYNPSFEFSCAVGTFIDYDGEY